MGCQRKKKETLEFTRAKMEMTTKRKIPETLSQGTGRDHGSLPPASWGGNSSMVLAMHTQSKREEKWGGGARDWGRGERRAGWGGKLGGASKRRQNDIPAHLRNALVEGRKEGGKRRPEGGARELFNRVGSRKPPGSCGRLTQVKKLVPPSVFFPCEREGTANISGNQRQEIVRGRKGENVDRAATNQKQTLIDEKRGKK